MAVVLAIGAQSNAHGCTTTAVLMVAAIRNAAITINRGVDTLVVRTNAPSRHEI